MLVRKPLPTASQGQGCGLDRRQGDLSLSGDSLHWAVIHRKAQFLYILSTSRMTPFHLFPKVVLKQQVYKNMERPTKQRRSCPKSWHEWLMESIPHLKLTLYEERGAPLKREHPTHTGDIYPQSPLPLKWKRCVSAWWFATNSTLTPLAEGIYVCSC